MIQDIYLKIRGKGPPSALGVRSGCYLRLERSRIYIFTDQGTKDLLQPLV